MRAPRCGVLVCGVVVLATGAGRAQDQGQAVMASIEARRDHYAQLARRIWDLAEVGYRETESAALLQQELKSAGFRIETGVAGMPTSFVASYGEGQPVIAILAEYRRTPWHYAGRRSRSEASRRERRWSRVRP